MKLQRGPRKGGKKSGEYTEHVCQESGRGLIEGRRGKPEKRGRERTGSQESAKKKKNV